MDLQISLNRFRDDHFELCHSMSFWSFVFSTVYCRIKMLIAGFEPRSSCVEGDYSVNCLTTIQCDQMKTKRKPNFYKSCLKSGHCSFAKKRWRFSKWPKQPSNIWATFVNKSVVKNFQKSTTLLTTTHGSTEKHLPTASQCCCLHKQARIIFEWFFGSSIHRFLASPCSSKPWEKQKKQQINLNLNKKIVNSFFQIIRWRLCFKLWWIIFK